MSHEYRLRFEITGASERETDTILDEVVPKWWSGDYGREGDVIWIDGHYRIFGPDGPREVRVALVERLTQLLGHPVAVRITGADLEGVDYGTPINEGP
jgi:hypothetical protein